MAKRPLQLFTDFVAAVSNADGFSPSQASQYATAIQVLCEKSPAVAQFFVREISSFLDAGESSAEESEPEAALALSRKRKRVSDGAYIPPKPARKVTGAAATKDHDHPPEHTPEPSLTVGTGLESADIAEETSKKGQIMVEADRGPGGGRRQPNQRSGQLEGNSSGRSALTSANAGSTEEAVSRSGPLSVTQQDASPAAEPRTDDRPQSIEFNATRSVHGDSLADQANGVPGPPQPKDLDGAENSDSYEASTRVVSPVAQDEPLALLEPRDAGERVDLPGDNECSPRPRCMPSKDGTPEVIGAESMTASNRGKKRPLHLITSSEGTLVEPEGHSSAKTGQHRAQTSLPSTPKPQVTQAELPSPPTEEIPRGSGSALHMLLPEPPSPSSAMVGYSFDDFINEMVEVVGTLSHSNDQVSTVAHWTIFKSLQISVHPLLEATAPAEADDVWTMNPRAWSGGMWSRYLEEGESRSQKSVIFKLIGYMGFAAWFEAGFAAYKATMTTRRGSRKLATSFLSDSVMKEEAAEGEPRKRRKLSVDHPEGSLAARQLGPVSKIANGKRPTINAQLHKGRKLRTMVSKVGLWILLQRNIWNYIKSPGDELWETAATEFQHDPRRDAFLAILNEQVTLLVQHGATKLSLFLESLETQHIVSQREVLRLRAQFSAEKGLLPRGSVNDAVDDLTRAISELGGDVDPSPVVSVRVRDAVEVNLKSFDGLRSGNWLHFDLIAAVMELMDKPTWVRYGLSVPLDEFINRESKQRKTPLHADSDGVILLDEDSDEKNPLDEGSGRETPPKENSDSRDRKTRPIEDLFRRWRKKIKTYRSERGHDERFVFFCPLNIGTNHFTLLEINEQSKTIYHYDSMAASNVISGKTRLTRVKRLVQAEFGDLGFRYREAPCPQQKDSSSCGLMVIRNADLRMNGRKVGTWKEKVDPEEIRMDWVRSLRTALDKKILQPVWRGS